MQQISGSLLYCAGAIESPILPALNKISHCQASPTINTYNKCKMLLDYCATHPNGKICFHASQMILHVDTDAAYLVLPKTRSRIAGYYYLAQYPTTDAIPKPTLNGTIHVECKTLKHVVASATEAETGGLSHNRKIILQIRQTLAALGHPQPPTPLKTDNSTSYRFVHNKMKQKMSKSWDMRFNWLRDKAKVKKLLRIYWERRTKNWANYFTKHHPPAHHKLMRRFYMSDNYHPTDK